MGKDPAFLFYPNDYIGGTMGMTFEEKGAYMELLMMQFNRGHMSGHMIGQTIGQLWDTIKDKFIQDNKGLWYNKRLEEEQIKRKKFTDSRKNNLSGKNQYNDKGGHKTKLMENENEDEDENRRFKKPTIKEVEKYFSEWGYNGAEKFYNYYETGNWKDSKGNKIKNWKQKAQGVWFSEENKKHRPGDPLFESTETALV